LRTIIIFCLLNIFIQANNFLVCQYTNNNLNIKINIDLIKVEDNMNFYKDIFLDISDIDENRILISKLDYERYKYELNINNITEEEKIFKGYFKFKGRKFKHLRFPYLKIINNELHYLKSIVINYAHNSGNLKVYSEENFIFIKQDNYINKKVKEIKEIKNWFNSNQIYYKLSLNQDGLYKIDFEFLKSINFPVNNVSPKNIKLFYKGSEYPLYFHGNNDDIFTSDEYFIFIGNKNYSNGDYRKVAEYGKPYNEYLDRYTDSSYYWLTYDNNNSLRITNNYSIQTYQDEINYYDCLIHDEANVYFDFPTDAQIRREFPDWIENKTWTKGWGDSPTLKLNNIVPNKVAKFYWKVLSRSASTITNAHQVGVRVNGSNYLITEYFDRYKHKVVSTSFNSDLLKEGDNSFSLDVLNGTGIFHDWFEIEYPKKLIFNDSLIFDFRNNIEFNKPYKIKILNVNTNEVILLKKEKEYQKIYFIDIFTKNGDTLIFIDTIKQNSQYYLYNVNKIKNPKFLYQKIFENNLIKHSTTDYILITHSKFIKVAHKYCDYLKNYYNLNAAVVDVNDIYDNYNFGYFAPEPIKLFLKDYYEMSDEPKPRYLFLVGDATYDYYNNRAKYGDAPKQNNWVPSYGAPVSDTWFVIWDTTGANIPQMAVGRLPINSTEEFENYFQRHKNYNDKKIDRWNKSFIFFSGGNTTNNQYLEIKNINDGIINNFIKPYGGFYEHFYKTVNPVTNFGLNVTQNYFEEIINNSALFISYLGHSAVSTWDNGIYDILQLNSKYNLYPIILDFGCSTGKFAEPDIVAFSEYATVRNNSKAINYLGNSSLGYTSTAYTVPYIFYQKAIEKQNITIGELHNLIKNDICKTYSNSGSYLLYKYTNILFGDPIIYVKLPNKVNLAIDKQSWKFSKENVSDIDDSILVKVKYFNYGNPINDTFNIKITHIYNNETITREILRNIPKNSDSIQFPVYTKSKSGMNKIIIELNYDNKIDEYDYNDNKFEYTFIVKNSSYYTVPAIKSENISVKELKVLNPQNKINNKTFFEYSLKQDFANSYKILLNPDSNYTTISFDNVENDSRVWYKIVNQNNEIMTQGSFIYSDYGLLFGDSLSFSQNTKSYNLKYISSGLVLDTAKYKIELISGGYNDGNTAFILLNGQQLIPENSVRGHHIYLFDRNTLKPIWGRRYDLFNSSDVVAYDNMLDTLSDKFYIAIVIKDEGSTNLSQSIRDKLKLFGSKYADSISFRASWGILGYRGAKVGSVPETFKIQYNGTAKCDTTFLIVKNDGKVIIDIDNYDGIEQILVNDTLQQNNTISYKLIGIKKDNTEDTLSNALPFINIVNNWKRAIIDYKILKNYPKIVLIGYFNNDINDNFVPILKKIKVIKNKLAELLVNDKSIQLEKDTIYQGKGLNVNYSVWNISDKDADSLNIKVYLKKLDNSYTKLREEHVKLLKNSVYKNNLSIDTKFLQNNNTVYLFIDSLNKIDEYYKTNNQISKYFYVQKDTGKPIVNITIDNNPNLSLSIFNDGKLMKTLDNKNYISSNPLIKIELTDDTNIPVNDTSNIMIFVNDKKVNYYNNNEITIEFNSQNPLIRVNYMPKLKDDEYELKVIGKDYNGNFSDPIIKKFKVKSDLELQVVYNYPNPFERGTYFTFVLSQIPDEVEISIYTVAGRKIKEIRRSRAELLYDYNYIYWDGNDEDNNNIANGVYFYKFKVKSKNKTITKIGKIAKIK